MTTAQPLSSASSRVNIAPDSNGSSSSDGAQPSATPVVPWAHETSGSGPSASSGATTTALATAGSVPSPVVV